ncbi:MAG TPA: insulinase family protein [Actinoplanes sp.]|nr:insulinase family protein [Actinoplanes sp.]
MTIIPGTSIVIQEGEHGRIRWYAAEHRAGGLVAFQLLVPLVSPSAAEAYALVVQDLINSPGTDASTSAVGLSVRVTCRGEAMRVRGSFLSGFGAVVAAALRQILTRPIDPAALHSAQQRAARKKKIADASPAHSAQARLLTTLDIEAEDIGTPSPQPEELAFCDTRVCASGRGAVAFAEAVVSEFATLAGTTELPAVAASVSILPRKTVFLHGSRRDSFVLVGGPAPARDDPDFPAAEVAMSLLGGSPASLLFRSLREARGLSYGPSARVAVHRRGAVYSISLHTPPQHAEAVCAEIHRSLDELAERPVPAAHITDAARYVRGTYLLSLATVAGQSAAIAAMVPRPGLTALSEYPERLGAVGGDELRRVAARMFGDGRRLSFVTRTDG